ncbi:MAG: SDR family NAD(P)-dependent oxidoreductase [Gammaproteobacteria bacterium]
MTDRTADGEDAALVIGASRGIGLALVRQLLDEGAFETVYATHRGKLAGPELERLAKKHPDLLRPLPCDVTDDHSIGNMAQQLKEEGLALTLVLHAAGILHEPGLGPEKALSQLRRESLARLFDVNAFGPLLVAQAVLGSVPRRRPAQYAVLSAMDGSIGDNRLGGWYGYRASKSALNQLLRTLAIEARRTHPGLCVTAIHPGTTDTDLSRPFQGNVAEDRLYTPARSAARILGVVRGGRPEDSGRFMNWNGEAIPW